MESLTNLSSPETEDSSTNLFSLKSQVDAANHELLTANINCKKTLGLIILSQIFLRYKLRQETALKIHDLDLLSCSFKDFSSWGSLSGVGHSTIPLVPETIVSEDYLEGEDVEGSFISEIVIKDVEQGGMEILHLEEGDKMVGMPIGIRYSI